MAIIELALGSREESLIATCEQTYFSNPLSFSLHIVSI